MAYKSCAATIAANIQQDCNKPLVGGYTGRAVIIPANDFARADVVRSATNPREILSIILPPDGSVLPYSIDNVFQTPFTGSTTAGNADNGRNGYLKTLALRIPMRGADVSKDIVEPLVKDPAGFVVIVEKRDKVGDGSFEVIGYQNSLRGDISSLTRDESANGGDWLVNLTSVESWAEVTLVGAGQNYETAKKNFDELLNFEPTETRLVFVNSGENSILLSANGLVTIESIYGGTKKRETYSALQGTSVTINSDADTQVVLFGAITSLRAYTGGTYDAIKMLDLSKNPFISELYCDGCTSLTTLDLSKNNNLVHLAVNDCTGLMLLDIQNTQTLSSGTILDQSMANLTTLQVAGTSAWAYEKVESWLSDFAPDNGMIYVDENTPQGVITEAEGKSWEVVYVS